MDKGRRSLLGAAIALAIGGGAQAQERTDVIDLAGWDPGSIENGWSAEQLIDIEVRDVDGDAIGEVENIIVGPDDSVAAIVLEVGGFLDIGDTHFRVPWENVEVDPSGELAYVTVPIEDDNYDRFSLFGDGGDVGTAEREWRATELIGDYVSLDASSLADYGYVNDLVFGADGALEAIVVNRNYAYGGGYYAYPYYGYDHGFDPGTDSYALPYSEEDVTGHDAFDYSPYAS